ncbi:hypothetical protein CDD83_10355 [Cordyceps sp. RAO-2017]|nr:hypothetical protein CDD83_10355 [Cordyceps sp. RAO-2017]
MSAELESQASFEASPLGFLYRQFARPKPLPADRRLTGQTAIVTGSNIGLGLEASRQLLALGLAHLVMAVRSEAKGNAAADRLRAEFPACAISVWPLDLESYESVCAFADRCSTTLSRLDIAILNAGQIQTSYAVVPATGHERTLQVNYLSNALLALLLLPVFKAKRANGRAEPPVLTLVGSDVAYVAEIQTTSPLLPQLDRPDGFNQFAWYFKSKLLLILFVSKLADLVNPDDVLVNMANPGMTRGTAFFRDMPVMMATFMGASQWLLGRALAVAASTYVDAAVAYGKESHGAFTSEWTIKPYPKICYTPEGREVRERLWEETTKELGFAGAVTAIDGSKARAGER